MTLYVNNKVTKPIFISRTHYLKTFENWPLKWKKNLVQPRIQLKVWWIDSSSLNWKNSRQDTQFTDVWLRRSLRYSFRNLHQPCGDWDAKTWTSSIRDLYSSIVRGRFLSNPDHRVLSRSDRDKIKVIFITSSQKLRGLISKNELTYSHCRSAY
jgi:hypothetical protein